MNIHRWVLGVTVCGLLCGCARDQVSVDPAGTGLENTEWTLVRLNGEAVSVANPKHTPNLALQPAEKRVFGTGGCNRMSGAYELKGEQLTFGPLIGTRMACMEGMELEQRFLDALPRTAKWRVTGRQLELLDAGGRAIAQFESR